MSAGVDLTRAAAKGDVRTVKRVLAAGTPPNAKGAHGNTALHLAAAKGHTAVVRALLAAHAPVDSRAADGCTPLCRAAEHGHSEIAAMLLVSGADPGFVTPKYSTPLFMAAEHGHEAVVEVLLQGGADPECWNPAGESPVYLAVQNGHAAATEALLAGGTHPDTTTPEGLTLLQLAAKCGQAEVITALCEGGAHVHVTDAQGDTALHTLVQCWRDSKQLPNGKTDGKTEQYTAAAQALLDGGADPWVHNNADKTPINLASDSGNTRLTQLMIAAVPSPSAAMTSRKLPPEPVLQEPTTPTLGTQPKPAVSTALSSCDGSPPSTPGASIDGFLPLTGSGGSMRSVPSSAASSGYTPTRGPSGVSTNSQSSRASMDMSRINSRNASSFLSGRVSVDLNSYRPGGRNASVDLNRLSARPGSGAANSRGSMDPCSYQRNASVDLNRVAGRPVSSFMSSYRPSVDLTRPVSGPASSSPFTTTTTAATASTPVPRTSVDLTGNGAQAAASPFLSSGTDAVNLAGAGGNTASSPFLSSGGVTEFSKPSRTPCSATSGPRCPSGDLNRPQVSSRLLRPTASSTNKVMPSARGGVSGGSRNSSLALERQGAGNSPPRRSPGSGIYAAHEEPAAAMMSGSPPRMPSSVLAAEEPARSLVLGEKQASVRELSTVEEATPQMSQLSGSLLAEDSAALSTRLVEQQGSICELETVLEVERTEEVEQVVTPTKAVDKAPRLPSAESSGSAGAETPLQADRRAVACPSPFEQPAVVAAAAPLPAVPMVAVGDKAPAGCGCTIM